MGNCCRQFLKKRMYRAETRGILNYFTLQISDPEVAKELDDHKIRQQNSIFWVSQPPALVALMVQVYNRFILNQQSASAFFLALLITQFFFSFIWGLCYFRFKKYTRYVFQVWFIVIAATLIACTKSNPDSFFYSQVGFDYWIIIT